MYYVVICQHTHSMSIVAQEIQTQGCILQIFGKLCPEKLKKCLVSLCNLHNSHGIKCRRELEKTVGMAFQRMGPK